MELRVALRHFRKHGGEVSRAERKRHGNPQAAAQLTGWEDRFPGRLDLGAGSGRMVSERDSRFCERGAAGRSCKKLHAKWTEICVAMPTIQALGEGWDVTVVTDASGAVSVEAHEVAIQRMIAAGANMMTWLAVVSEWQRDWARTDHAAELAQVLVQHAAGSGIAFLWEQQLLNTPVPSEG